MKRSDWVEATVKALSKPGAWITFPAGMRLADLPRGITSAEETAEEMAKWMDTHSGFLPWDPEEEPLPEKLVWYGGRMAEDVGMDPAKSLFRYVALPALGANQDQSNRNVKILKAALEAYNEIGVLRKKLENVQRCADRSDQLVDRWKGVVERAIEHMETKALCPTWARDLLAILKEEKA